MKASEQYLLRIQFIMLYKVVITFKSMVEIHIKCDNSHERYWAALTLFIILYKVALIFKS